MALRRMLKDFINDLTISQCCFCGERIVEEVPLDISLNLPDGVGQHMQAHGKCFQERLHPSVPFLTPMELLEEDEQ